MKDTIFWKQTTNNHEMKANKLKHTHQYFATCRYDTISAQNYRDSLQRVGHDGSNYVVIIENILKLLMIMNLELARRITA